MASPGDVQVVPEVKQPAVADAAPEHGAKVAQLVAVEACGGGSGLVSSATTTTTAKEESVMTSTVLQEHDTEPQPDHHHEDAAAAPAEVPATVAKGGEEAGHNSKVPADGEDDHHQDSTRERLKRHRQEVAGRVWVPEKWGQEKLLKDWVDCAVFDRPLVPAGLLTARRALVAESCTRRRSDRTSTTTTVSSAAGSSPLRVRNGCS